LIKKIGKLPASFSVKVEQALKVHLDLT